MLLALSELRWVGGHQVKHDGRKDLMRKIQTAQEELIKADDAKRKDLKKYIHDLKKELRMYDRYNTGARLRKG